ncbi:MAG: zinc metallopeptidase [Chitinophagales bacterium]|mgnify:CR=1 FL=1|nr:zinc metallopeptidase [Chitinophagales bacterium]MCO5279578.1 zinc metallopeptidase [Chitinophagales bacterium]HRN93645.1 zinc metallopeptidase [Chitinophagales bacterium]HRP40028.1 zinc metallopeptidase [Chitinophagales bacterium]
MWIILMVVIFGASALVSWRLKSKFSEYSQISFRGNLSGAEIADKMLKDNGITDVKIICVEGQLTDHYNPADKTVNLSTDVYHGRSVASAAVAAHECGHAVQHARAYAWLGMRSALVPAVSFSSKYMQWILLAGVLTINVFPYLLLAGIVLFAMTTIFSFVTLPVEFDASKRALNWLETSGVTTSQEHDLAYDALKWAAMTYVVAALGSLATLLYYVSIFMRRRD